jgi:hypothetical protein
MVLANPRSRVKTTAYGAMCRVGQNRIFIPYMTVCSVISLPKMPNIHHIYMCVCKYIYIYIYIYIYTVLAIPSRMQFVMTPLV